MNLDGVRIAGRQLDLSLLTLLLSNLLTLILAVAYQWPVAQILWIYWAQSVIIGISNVIRMLRLKEFSTKGIKMNGKPVPETPAAKRQTIIFRRY